MRRGRVSWRPGGSGRSCGERVWVAPHHRAGGNRPSGDPGRGAGPARAGSRHPRRRRGDGEEGDHLARRPQPTRRHPVDGRGGDRLATLRHPRGQAQPFPAARHQHHHAEAPFPPVAASWAASAASSKPAAPSACRRAERPMRGRRRAGPGPGCSTRPDITIESDGTASLSGWLYDPSAATGSTAASMIKCALNLGTSATIQTVSGTAGQGRAGRHRRHGPGGAPDGRADRDHGDDGNDDGLDHHDAGRRRLIRRRGDGAGLPDGA